ncbi:MULTISPECIES: NUDIX domain-containing protein [Streptomyces]|uniref:NUDIX domain-containing protein n=1 Tax=Streptomyces TaxID=1883 RepID=UPI0018F345D5|nr:NUDIX domain-containing protein [Streptomyces murinus]WSI83439.1 NUDIX domain-containing protein [Streptomyces murinus]
MENAVQAVVVYDGRLLLVREADGWVLPSGTGQPAETAEATAARVVYELTGYLADGSAALDGGPAVLCQLLSEDPSDGARLAPEDIRWTPNGETAGIALPEAVRDYLEGHTPV